MVRYSRQREAIRKQVSGRGDHPTAETLYAELKQEIPELSLATVYRNLRQLVDAGEIVRMDVYGAARYDWNVDPHSHFFCSKCGCVIDFPEADGSISRDLIDGFEGSIVTAASNYYGLCAKCRNESFKD